MVGQDPIEKMVRLSRVKEQRVKLAKNLSIRYATRQHRGACVCKVLTNRTSRPIVKQKVYQKIDLVETDKAQNIGSVEIPQEAFLAVLKTEE